MKYYFNTILKNLTFDEAIARVIHELKNEGFGILTEIDIQSIFNIKLQVDFYNYKILGACHASFAYKALQVEDKIGTMLPCNVIVQEREKGVIEVSVVDPSASMASVENKALVIIAEQIRVKLKKIIKNLE
ncbi:DUF302 domain-containing protein [Aquimarina addita]|uniref:DUF302 domain-containing protein n=1 Tax=Aquimarina addita TaxID=870485 RepID=A0ABP7XDR8_9FLAO